MSWTLSILLQEVLGYDVSYFETDSGGLASQRMSSVGLGTFVPTHYNAEVWAASKLQVLNVYENESIGSNNGYYGQAGWFTLTSNVNEALLGPNSTRGIFQRSYSADFWHDYVRSNDLVNYYSVNNINISAFISTDYCADGTKGCESGCSKSYACTVADNQGQSCMMVLMMDPDYDPGFLQAAIANNDIPAYFCFVGGDEAENIVVNMMETNGPVTFYHNEPDLFHMKYEGKITRIALPRTDPIIVKSATGTFGENGYGQPTTNPVSVDFPLEPLQKYYAKLLSQDIYLVNFLGKVQITQSEMNDLLLDLSKLSDPYAVNSSFVAACNWIKANYMTWKTWLDPLPLCTISKHVVYTIAGCNTNVSGTFRNISFAWTTPNPLNPSLPSICDGGVVSLPSPIVTSKSCDWLNANPDQWKQWIDAKPLCDTSYYNYTVSSCDGDGSAQRTVTFSWLLPRANNSTKSVECTGGVALPTNTVIDCDYIPTDSDAYSAITALSAIAMVFRSVIKRAQWPLLLVMLLGGLFLCIYVVLGGGAPTSALCGSRPVLLVVGYTLIFGSLLVKSLRVYWIFCNKSLKKVTVSLWKIVKILLVLLAIDIVILVAWLAADFPSPTVVTKPSTAFVGHVDNLTCHSSSFIFAALIIFWKAIITFVGMYVSFLVRHAGSDFQESVWIFISSCVVMMGAIVLLPLAYMTDLPPLVTYSFESIVILLGIVAVVGCMLLPKFLRLGEQGKKSTTRGGTRGSGASTAVSASQSVTRQSVFRQVFIAKPKQQPST
ncbi:unnamed protein product [Aphanomyces euteiches]